MENNKITTKSLIISIVIGFLIALVGALLHILKGDFSELTMGIGLTLEFAAVFLLICTAIFKKSKALSLK